MSLGVADAALEAGLAQALEDLLRAVRMGVDPAHDLRLEGIELAGARRTGTRPELINIGPLGHRARVQPERTRGLCAMLSRWRPRGSRIWQKVS